MKLAVALLLGVSAGALSCSHDPPPRSAHNAARPQLRRPTLLGTTTSPPTIAPDTLASPGGAAPPDDPRLSPASGIGEPRAVSPRPVPGDAAMNLADTAEDHESIQDIRAAIAADKSLSAAAKEVTLVARNGRVWLRGHVSTADERAAIERAARQAAGVMEVHNELVVAE